MNPEIKQRIEQLNNGELPEGYKKTDFGVFPYDWETDKTLGEICQVNPKSDHLPKQFVYIDLESVQDRKIVHESIISCKHAPSRAQRVLSNNDIIFQMVRPYQKNNLLFNDNKCEYPYVASTGYGLLRSNMQNFLFQIIHCDYFVNQVNAKCIGTNYPAINSEDLRKVSVAFPKIEYEQTKIAEILMTWDKAIDLYDKQIEALTRYKTICLRKMFPQKGQNSPEWRFQGFSDVWKHRELSDEFSDFIVPMRDKPKDFGGCIPWTRIEDIEGKYLNGTLSDQYVSEETIKKMNLKIIPKDSLIVSSSATFGVVAIVTRNLITNQTFIGLVPYEKETIEFWYSFFQSDEPRKYMKLQSAGSTIFYIAREHFEKMPIKAPRKKERIKIGEFFSNLDNLITLHQRKKEKITNQRKTLQQYLLNGIVRV